MALGKGGSFGKKFGSEQPLSQPMPNVNHWYAHVFEVSTDLIDDLDKFKARARAFAQKLELTVVAVHGHFFGPGLTVLVILAESHLAFHTWPELNYVHLDIVCCGKELRKKQLQETIYTLLKTDYYHLRQV